MLVLFKRNDILGFGVLVFVAFVLRLNYFIYPPAIAELGDFYTNTFGRFNWLSNFYTASPRFYIFGSTIFWLAFSVFFKEILVNEKLVSQRNFIGAIAFFVITSALPPFIIFSVAALAACCLFIAFSIVLGTPYNKPARSRYFVVGFFVGLATALYWPAFIAFLALLFILLSIRIFVAQELLALVFGMLFPVYLIVALHYVFSGNLLSFGTLALPLSLPVALQYKVGMVVFAGLLIFLTFYGLYISRNKIVDNKIQIIKKWNGVVLFLIASLLIGLSASIFPSNTLIFFLIPFSIILSSALVNNNTKYNTFTFYFVLISVLALQWVLRFI